MTASADPGRAGSQARKQPGLTSHHQTPIPRESCRSRPAPQTGTTHIPAIPAGNCRTFLLARAGELDAPLSVLTLNPEAPAGNSCSRAAATGSERAPCPDPAGTERASDQIRTTSRIRVPPRRGWTERTGPRPGRHLGAGVRHPARGAGVRHPARHDGAPAAG
jgi:hypothetical protein